MTHEIEQQLEQFVAQFGEKQVLEALNPLVTKWQMEGLAMRGQHKPPYSASEIRQRVS